MVNTTETQEANIYTLYSDNKPFYIGKTIKTKDGKIKFENMGVYYNNRKLNKKIKSVKNLKVRILVRTSQESKVWFKEKLERHKNYLSMKYKLINSDKTFGLWSAKYWLGKKRDKHTLKRLSESKFKPIAQYDIQGKLIKEWPSGKHASKHYRIYEVKDGSGASAIHSALLSNSRKWNNYLWYRKSELIEIYGIVPTQLNKFEINPPRANVKKLILKCNKAGKVIDFYYTPKEAAEANNTTIYFLQQNLNTGNKFANYYWKTDELRRDYRITGKV